MATKLHRQQHERKAILTYSTLTVERFQSKHFSHSLSCSARAPIAATTVTSRNRSRGISTDHRQTSDGIRPARRSHPAARTALERVDAEDGPDETRGAMDSAPSPLRVDGRRTHVVDRAIDYAALHAQGLTVARIARRRRRSKGYVSILLRLGQVLATLPSGEVAAMRSPRITWALAQRVVRADTPESEVRAQLRYALGGFSVHNVDRRRRGLRSPRGIAAGDQRISDEKQVGMAEVARAVTRGVLSGWGFDQALFASDPDAFIRAHLERLLAVHDAVEHRTIKESRLVAARGLVAGQGLRRLAAALQETPIRPREAAALRALAAFRAGLVAAMRSALSELDGDVAAEATVDAGTSRLGTSERPHTRPMVAAACGVSESVVVSSDELAGDLL